MPSGRDLRRVIIDGARGGGFRKIRLMSRRRRAIRGLGLAGLSIALVIGWVLATHGGATAAAALAPGQWTSATWSGTLTETASGNGDSLGNDPNIAATTTLHATVSFSASAAFGSDWRVDSVTGDGSNDVSQPDIPSDDDTCTLDYALAKADAGPTDFYYDPTSGEWKGSLFNILDQTELTNVSNSGPGVGDELCGGPPYSWAADPPFGWASSIASQAQEAAYSAAFEPNLAISGTSNPVSASFNYSFTEPLEGDVGTGSITDTIASTFTINTSSATQTPPPCGSDDMISQRSAAGAQGDECTCPDPADDVVLADALNAAEQITSDFEGKGTGHDAGAESQTAIMNRWSHQLLKRYPLPDLDRADRTRLAEQEAKKLDATLKGLLRKAISAANKAEARYVARAHCPEVKAKIHERYNQLRSDLRREYADDVQFIERGVLADIKGGCGCHI